MAEADATNVPQDRPSDSPEALEIEIQTIALRDLVPLEDAGIPNARFFTERQYTRLVTNLREDGVLTSVPLVARVEGSAGGSLIILSGNHRVKAAIEAGIERAPCIVVKNVLSRERAISVALSHNAISGQDDPNILSQLYSSLDLAGRMYSGLTDDDLNLLAPLDLSSLSIGAPKYEVLELLFLPGDRETFEQLIGEIEKRAKNHFGIASMHDFNAFFDTVVRAKSSLNIINITAAIRAIVSLANQRLDELDASKEEAE
jgi:hypothetical protein